MAYIAIGFIFLWGEFFEESICVFIMFNAALRMCEKENRAAGFIAQP